MEMNFWCLDNHAEGGCRTQKLAKGVKFSKKCFCIGNPLDLNVTCIRSAVPGHEIINCTSTNPLVSVVCAYDGGGPEVCSFPLVLGIERFGTDSHVVLVTATDGFGQTATMEFVFQLAGRKS